MSEIAAVTDRPSRVGTSRIVAESVAAAVVAYLVAGAAETGLIRAFRPSERELTWVSDIVLSGAFGVAVYLWRHLSVTRQRLMARERAELVLNAQLSVAADLQRRLLPALPAGGHRVEWAASLRSAGRIGGDFYDVVSLPGGQWMLLVADVSGKGIPAAMALSSVRAAFRVLAKPPNGPAQVLSQLSTTLYEQWAGTPYLTGIVAQIDVNAGTIRYANAGHPSGMVVGPAGVQAMESLGPPAALFTGVTYDERELGIGPGDVCVIVSDGVTEALGDLAGSVIEDIAHAADATPRRAQRVCDAIMAAALDGGGPEGVADWEDDRTVVVLACPGHPTAPPSHQSWAPQIGERA